MGAADFRPMSLPIPPVVVAARAAESGEATEFLVEMLAGERYGINGAIVVREEHIVHAGTVASGSGLAGAYRAANDSPPGVDVEP